MKDVFKDLWPIFGIFLLFFVLWIFLGGPQGKFEGANTGTRTGSSFSFLPSVQLVPDRVARTTSTSGGGTSDSSNSNGTVSDEVSFESPWKGKVRIQTGSARSATDPDKEYITISMSRAKEDVDITGWTLMNFRESDPVRSGANEFNRTNSEYVTIGYGASIASNTGGAGGERIVVPKGGRAIVTTGKPPKTFPVILAGSFRETKCTGYFESTENFNPGLRRSCDSPRKEIGIDNLSEACYDFIGSRVRTCGTPSYEAMEDISNQCRSYIRDHFTYQGCVAYHQYDEDFYEDSWRVYLGKSTEMWARSRETIRLFDANGLLVDEVSYR